MKTRHLPVRHLATPLLLSLLAACGGGGANPSVNMVSAPINGTQAGGSGGNGSKPGVAPGTNGTGSAGSGQAGGNQPGSSNPAGNGGQPGAGTSGNHSGSSDSPRERVSWTGCKLNYFRGGPVVADKTGSDPPVVPDEHRQPARLLDRRHGGWRGPARAGRLGPGDAG